MNYTNYVQHHSSVPPPNVIQPTITPTTLFASAIHALQNDLFTNIMTSINMDKNRQENILLVSVCKLIDKVAMNDAILNKFMDNEEKSQHNMMHSIEKRLINIDRSLQSLQKHISNKQDVTTFEKSMNILENKLKNKLQSLQQYSVDHADRDAKLNTKLTSIENNLKHITKHSNNNTNQLNKIHEQMQQIPRTSSIMHNINNSIKKIHQKLDNSNQQTQKQIHCISEQIEMHSTELQEGLMAHSIAMQSIKDMLKFNKSTSINHIKTTHTAPNTEPTPTTISTNAKPIPDSSSLNIDPSAVATISPNTPQSAVATTSPKTSKSKQIYSNKFPTKKTQTPIADVSSIKTNTEPTHTTTIKKPIPAPNPLIPPKKSPSDSIITVDIKQLQQITQAHLPSLISTESGSLAKTDGGSENIVFNNSSSITTNNQFNATHTNSTPQIFNEKSIATIAKDTTIEKSTPAPNQPSLTKSVSSKTIHSVISADKIISTTTLPTTPSVERATQERISNKKINDEYFPNYNSATLTSFNSTNKLLYYFEDDNYENDMDNYDFLLTFDRESNNYKYKIDANLKTLARNPFLPTKIIPSKEAIEAADEYKEIGNKLYHQKDFEAAIQCYELAQHLDPTNAKYILNESAAAFMLKDYEDTIRCCEEALLYANDIKWKCKAYKRMGAVEEQRGNINKCIEYYQNAQDIKFDSNLEGKLKSINNKHMT